MSQQLILHAQVRTTKGKNACRQLRAKGQMPAVFYTPTGTNLPVTVDESALTKLYKVVGRTAIFTLEIDNNGKKEAHTCLVWDAEYYPTKQRFQHIDFYGVDMDKEVKIRVPLEFVGTAKGVKVGGKMEIYRDRIDVWSKPATLPQKIVVDITDLDVDSGLRIEDLVMPEGVRPHYLDNFAILSINAPGGAADASDEADEA